MATRVIMFGQTGAFRIAPLDRIGGPNLRGPFKPGFGLSGEVPFSPTAAPSRFPEAGKAVSCGAVHAPGEAFSTVSRLTDPESDGRARGPAAQSGLHTAK